MPPLTSEDATDLFRRPPDALLDVGDAAVAHRVVGDGPDVLFVHGWPVSGATFRLLLPHLATHVRCHVVDLPGAGSSGFDDRTDVTVARQISTVRELVDLLGLEDYAVVAHDSGGLVARHALVGDRRLRAMCLIDTEHPAATSWRFRSFLAARRAPGLAAALGTVARRRWLRRHPLVFGRAFTDRAHLEGDFDELFFQPLRNSSKHRRAAARYLRSFDPGLIDDLADIHRRIEVPVRLVWGAEDAFFPVGAASVVTDTFADAQLSVIEGAGLFPHEERPAAVADALWATLGELPR